MDSHRPRWPNRSLIRDEATAVILTVVALALAVVVAGGFLGARQQMGASAVTTADQPSQADHRQRPSPGPSALALLDSAPVR